MIPQQVQVLEQQVLQQEQIQEKKIQLSVEVNITRLKNVQQLVD